MVMDLRVPRMNVSFTDGGGMLSAGYKHDAVRRPVCEAGLTRTNDGMQLHGWVQAEVVHGDQHRVFRIQQVDACWESFLNIGSKDPGVGLHQDTVPDFLLFGRRYQA